MVNPAVFSSDDISLLDGEEQDPLQEAEGWWVHGGFGGGGRGRVEGGHGGGYDGKICD